MAIRSFIYPLILLVAWLLAQVGKASERVPRPAKEDQQIVVEVQVLLLNERMAERFRTLGRFSESKGGEGNLAPTAVLTPKQVQAWVSMFYEDSGTSLVVAPRLTVLNGR